MPRQPSKHSLFPGAYELNPAATQPHIRIPEEGIKASEERRKPAVVRDMSSPKPSRAERGSFLADPRDIYVEQIEIAHAGTSDTTDAAAKAFAARFTRAMVAAGTGALSAVVEDHDDASADTTAATRSLGNVTLTLAESTEYQVAASITIDLTGTAVDTAEVVALVELFWTGFLTTPETVPA